jgi:hypothetical protein
MPDSDTQVIEQDADASEFQIPVLDENLVAQICSQALIDQGFAARDRSGHLIADPGPMKQAVLAAMEDNHVVTSSKDLAAKAVTPAELYAEVLPDGPGVTSLPDNPEAAAARDKLKALIWASTNTGTSGYVQKGIEHSNMVLCEAPVPRNLVSEETGKKEATSPMGRFLTSDDALILKHYTAPAGLKFAQQARALQNKLGMVTKRKPELTGAVARQMQAVVKTAVDSIPSANPKTAAALNAGTSVNGDEA